MLPADRPAGEIRIGTDTSIQDSGLPDAVDPMAIQHAVEDLPSDTLVYLQGSRYCETDRLWKTARLLLGHIPLGWSRGLAERQNSRFVSAPLGRSLRL